MYARYCKIRDSKGLKDSDVARLSGVTKSTFSDWKAGRYEPKDEKLEKIAKVLGTTARYLRTGEIEETALSSVYFSLAKEAEENGINPDDIRLALETIKRLRRE